MASVVNDPNGRKRILFVVPDESRKAIRLGKCDRKSAEAIARHVEALLAAKIGGQPVPRDTAVWLSGIGASLRDKPAAVGLVEPLQRLTVGEFLTSWLAGKKAAGHAPRATTAGPARTCGPRSPKSFGGLAWNRGRACGIRCEHRVNRTWPRVSRWPR
jgi:hypothetical protein